MPYPILSVAFITVAAVGVAQALGQGMVAEPYARVFASPSGRVGLKVLPKGNDVARAATAIAFTLGADGSEKVLWRRELLNLPGEVSIFEDGQEVYVVTLDRWGTAGGHHAMVVYGTKGEVLQDVRSDALRATVPPSDSPAAGATPPSARARIRAAGETWRAGATLQFVRGNGETRIELRWPDGGVASVPLPAGPVRPVGGASR